MMGLRRAEEEGAFREGCDAKAFAISDAKRS